MYGGPSPTTLTPKYTADSPRTQQAIQTLYDAETASTLTLPSQAATRSLLFRNGPARWLSAGNIAQQPERRLNNDAGLTNSGDEIMPIGIPDCKRATRSSAAAIWGFGVFDNGA